MKRCRIASSNDEMEEVQSNGPDDADADTFRILVATDVHLGVHEKDPIRGKDSLRTFKEILQLAVSHHADFLLLAGDLFHANQPSQRVMHCCLDLLRRYCLGDRPQLFELLSDSERVFSGGANFESLNHNVGLPVLTIHGNHDDPLGPKGENCLRDSFL